MSDGSKASEYELYSSIVFEHLPKTTPLIFKLGGPGFLSGRRGSEVDSFCIDFGAEVWKKFPHLVGPWGCGGLAFWGTGGFSFHFLWGIVGKSGHQGFGKKLQRVGEHY